MSLAAFKVEKESESTDSGNAEQELIDRCRTGERKAQFELYQRYKDHVFNIAYRMCHNRQEAEDITQQVFIRIFHKLHTFRGDAAFTSWFYRLTMNICINHFRKEKRRKQHFTSELQDWELGKNQRQKSKFNFKPYLEKAIRKLPEGYRAVFVLYDVEGHPHSEIAKMLNISEGTSKSQLHKARKELRHMLEPYLLLNKSL